MGEAEELKYPKSVFFIVSNEFCERFSYYGMRTILILYFTNVLKFSDDTATVVYHVFTMLCYFTPLLGAMLADSFLGKFRTIFYVSIIYAIGNIILSLAATPPLHLPTIAFSMLGLLLIALGTGGIKPCVSAFGGDQFILPEQERQLQRFFSIFYFSINSGSLLSTFLTPILREDVKCFGGDTCYPLAFGVPAVLMIVAIIVFVSGKSLYVIKKPGENIVAKVSMCIGHGIAKRIKNNGRKCDHWLDHADDKYDQKLIEDVKALLRVLFLYIPLPFFWALFDQQGSRWTLQATVMDGYMFGYVIKPDQMQVVNPLLILILIPVFETVIYPLFAKCNLLKRPLQRMVLGGLLAGLAFMLSGFIELQLEHSYPPEVPHRQAELQIINMMNCNVSVMRLPATEADIIYADGMRRYSVNNAIHVGQMNVLIEVPADCGVEARIWNASLNAPEAKRQTYYITQNGTSTVDIVKAEQVDDFEKSEIGDARIRLIHSLGPPDDPANNYTGSYIELRKKGSNKIYKIQLNSSVNTTEYISVQFGTYNVHFPRTDDHSTVVDDSAGTLELGTGGVYTATAVRSDKEAVHTYIDTYPNSVHMLWLIPQYFVMTMGEVMFSITGLEFSYSQSPESMKSVLQAAWLMTVAFGNLIVVIIAEAKFFERQAFEFFLFAVLMFIDMGIFIAMAMSYQYVVVEDTVELKPPKGKGKENKGFQEDTGM